MVVNNFSERTLMVYSFSNTKLLILLVVFSITSVYGCSVDASRGSNDASRNATSKTGDSQSSQNEITKGPTIKIEPNSPADTVRVFYNSLREKKFREAIYLTNLRPAIEGLTDAELKEFQVDFEAISQQVPQELQINGEIISGDSATVTAKLPGEDPDKLELQQIRLRRENGVWVILTVDEEAEKQIKQEGKNYFYQLRIDTHHDEARKMLDRMSKAELAYSLQNQGVFAEIPALIGSGFVPPDVSASETTGYNYAVKLSSDRKKYTASAVPSVYGKTGKLSFWVELDGKGSPHLTSKDNGGAALKK